MGPAYIRRCFRKVKNFVMDPESKRKYWQFQLAEAIWLDGEMKKILPRWVSWCVKSAGGSQSVIGRILTFTVDFLVIGKILGFKITRAQDTTLLGGKGFRKGVDHGYRVDRVRTKLFKRGKEFAEQSFSLGIIIKKDLS